MRRRFALCYNAALVVKKAEPEGSAFFIKQGYKTMPRLLAKQHDAIGFSVCRFAITLAFINKRLDFFDELVLVGVVR